jgi:hypothetical protein
LSDLHEVALTEEEKETILSHCGPEPLLVGGQALAFWAIRFEVETPAALSTSVTTDADFIGTRLNARALNEHLHWKLWTTPMGESTPQTAKLTKIVENNGVKQVDYLHSIVGLETSDARKRAVSVTLPPNALINVLHPVDVLVSRLKNLQHLPAKQNEIGVAQAHLAIKIVNAFVKTLLGSDSQRQLFKWIERIIDLAHDKSLGSTLDRYKLDPLVSIPIDLIDHPEFKSKRWPQILATSHENKDTRAALQARPKKARKRPNRR